MEEKKQKLLLNVDEQYTKILRRIKDLLMMKAYKQGIPQFENNKTFLGDQSFWFQQAEDNNFYLVYTTPPETWDMDSVLEDVLELEHELYYKEQVNEW